ncbi:YopX family protein [Lactiplantibacillus plantarum]|uniref:YopX family protein n=1 Tax=Lactiplantibacillus plantarum TaxID=1590 RepID=UPI0024682C55|nr:YopX family protein [Lactiplantibacillus plantarum]MDH5110609.1 YopX family protein [Lactiplantibacillus plantarum]
MIKFRAWAKIQKKMLVPDNIEFIHGQAYWAEASTGDNGSYSNDGETDGIGALFELEQFIGLTDVNGKDIYEGDIVHGYDQEPDRDDGYIGSSVTDVVNFKYGAFWIGDSWYKVMVMTPPIVEIIGNVHENPELLKG